MTREYLNTDTGEVIKSEAELIEIPEEFNYAYKGQYENIWLRENKIQSVNGNENFWKLIWQRNKGQS